MERARHHGSRAGVAIRGRSNLHFVRVGTGLLLGYSGMLELTWVPHTDRTSQLNFTYDMNFVFNVKIFQGQFALLF